MPYIKRDMKAAALTRPVTAGELTHNLTLVVTEYIGVNELNFGRLAECVAALECAKLELYRRVIAPYENKKCRENGDVYPDRMLIKEI